MKVRAPRKAKKQAKRLKSAHDATVMIKAALSTAMHTIQLAHIASRPIPKFDPGAIPLKSVDVAQTVMHAAESMQNILSEIKPWQHFVKPKMRHL